LVKGGANLTWAKWLQPKKQNKMTKKDFYNFSDMSLISNHNNAVERE